MWKDFKERGFLEVRITPIIEFVNYLLREGGISDIGMSDKADLSLTSDAARPDLTIAACSFRN